MLSVEKCRDLLGENGKGMSNEEILELRNFMYKVLWLANKGGILETKDTISRNG